MTKQHTACIPATVPATAGAGAPAREYRGVMLPDGMTPALALKLEEMVVQYVDAAAGSDDGEELEWPFEFGIKVFREIAKNRESSTR